MINFDELTYDYKKTWVQGLVIDCPMLKALESCPAKDLRKLSI